MVAEKEEKAAPPKPPPAAPAAGEALTFERIAARVEAAINYLGPPGPVLESDLEVYPVREPSKDPRWAVLTVWIWVVFTLLSIVGILLLIVLGWYYD